MPPRNKSGSMRANTMSDTTSAEPVSDSANRLKASISSQRMTLTATPAPHSRAAPGRRITERRGERDSTGISMIGQLSIAALALQH